MVGAIIIGLHGRTPEWVPLALFLLAMTLITATAEFANTYTDRGEDHLYFPGNPLVTGELAVVTARKALIVQNVAAAILVVALLWVTRNYSLVLAILIGWFAGLAYSLPPLRFKETAVGPLFLATGYALPAVGAWLLVKPSLTAGNGFIIAFASVLFLHSLGYGITIKFRKTFHALNAGLIKVAPGGSVYDLSTVGLGLKVKTAMALEAVSTLGAFVLVPVYWWLGIFDAALSIPLLAAALPTTLFALVLRVRDPVGNGPKCLVFMTMAGVDIGMILFGVAVSSLVHWGFAVLACVVYLAGFIPLFMSVQPFRRRALAAPWLEF